MPERDGHGWGVWQVTCDRCGHRWVAVAPIEVEVLECGACGYLVPVDHNLSTFVPSHLNPTPEEN